MQSRFAVRQRGGEHDRKMTERELGEPVTKRARAARVYSWKADLRRGAADLDCSRDKDLAVSQAREGVSQHALQRKLIESSRPNREARGFQAPRKVSAIEAYVILLKIVRQSIGIGIQPLIDRPLAPKWHLHDRFPASAQHAPHFAHCFGVVVDVLKNMRTPDQVEGPAVKGHILDVDLVAYAGTADVRGVIVAGQSGDPLRQRSLWSKVQHTPQRLGQFILQQHIGEPMPFVRPAPWTFRIEPEEGTRLYGEELKPGPSAQGTLTPLCEAKETRDDQLVCATGGGRHMSHASMIGELRTSELLSAFYG